MQRNTSLVTAFGFFAYWLLHAFNTVRVSKTPGYYPPAARAKAAAILNAGPYPWSDIVETWVLLGILTAGLFLIYRFARLRHIYLVIYAFGALAIDMVVTGTDVGGVAYARGQYLLTTAVSTIVYAVVVGRRRARSVVT